MGGDARRQGELGALMRAAKTARRTVRGAVRATVSGMTSGTPSDTGHTDDIDASRREIADFCRYLGARLNGTATQENPRPIPEGLKLSPRMRQTLDRLLAGDSEKQIAAQLSVSQHTVHVYVKALYRGFEVCSRGELLAKFVRAPRT